MKTLSYIIVLQVISSSISTTDIVSYITDLSSKSIPSLEQLGAAESMDAHAVSSNNLTAVAKDKRAKDIHIGKYWKSH